LIIGAAILPLLKGHLRTLAVLLLPLVTLVLIWLIPENASLRTSFLEYELTLLRFHPATLIFATIFSIMAFAGGLYAYRQAHIIELSSAFAYAGAAISVTFAGDLITLFVFWEIMALFSALVLFINGSKESGRAGMRYLFVHLLGGVILMIGIVGHIAETGSIAFEIMKADSFSHYMILAGFLINAGAPPLSAWLPDAYPEASPSGTVFLSAFTTKTAVFVLLVGFAGTWLLIPIGLYMIFYGIIYALLENDMRRILAYSIVNQVGFMITGIGIGSEMALNGAAAHAFAHIIYKALLLMSAGAVLYQTGKRKCSDLGGLFQSMPITTTCAIIGALAISAFPLTSGFVTKSMISQSSADAHMTLVWFLLAAASAGVFLHAGVKFPWFVFFQKDSGMRPSEPPLNMRLAMYLFSFLCIALGIYPESLYAILPYTVDYVPYTPEHVVAQLQLLLFSGLAFFVLLPMMKRTLTISLDIDWLYRKLVFNIGKWMQKHVERTFNSVKGFIVQRGEDLLKFTSRHHGSQGILARTWPTGSMVLWIAILLGGYILLNVVMH
ncbi:MAG: Na(+)/H(+) antiporter subunit D, partial [Gammaproteobacteria bacterium]|nr:Na(+)/H(+) antiporter subunit D [Gammaproteobacteria bacterium]